MRLFKFLAVPPVGQTTVCFSMIVAIYNNSKTWDSRFHDWNRRIPRFLSAEVLRAGFQVRQHGASEVRLISYDDVRDVNFNLLLMEDRRISATYTKWDDHRDQMAFIFLTRRTVVTGSMATIEGAPSGPGPLRYNFMLIACINIFIDRSNRLLYRNC